MASGSFSGYYRSYQLRDDWSSSTNVAGNYSTVTINHYLVLPSGWSLYIGSRSNSCTCNESKNYTSPSISSGGGTTIHLGTTTHTVYHNADGTKSISVSDTFNMQATISGTYVSSITASATITLDTIPRASQPSCITYPNTTQNIGNLGDTITIHMNRASSSFTHTVKWAWGSSSGTIATNVGDNCQWTIPKSFANAVTNGTSGTGTISVDTYNGSTKIGTKSVNFTANIPNTSEFQPSISSVALEEMGSVPASFGFYVQKLSKIKGTITASGAYGSTISSYTTTINNETFTTAQWTTSLLSVVNPTLKVVVKDSRGRSATYQTTLTALKYDVPTINSFAAYRNSSNNALIDLVFSCSIYKLNTKNTKRFVFYYKKKTDAQYTSVEVSNANITSVESGNVVIYSANFSIVSSDSSASYDAYLEAIDSFNTIPSNSTFINTVFKLLNISANKTAFAIGKLHEVAGSIENALPQINYENIHRVEGNYDGLVLSCPSIEDGKLVYNSTDNTLELEIGNNTYAISLQLKS